MPNEKRAAPEGPAPLIERALCAIAPSWAAKRSEQRIRTQQLWAMESEVRTQLRNYDAGRHSRRTQGWNPMNPSGTTASSGFERLVARSRDMARNNEWMAKGLGVIEDDVVGTGFSVKFFHKDKGLAQAAQDRWAAWADSLEIDPEGLHDFAGKLGITTRGMAECGNMFLRRRWRRAEDGLSVPMQIQTMEGDHLDVSKNSIGNAGAKVVQGIEFDPIGRRAAYWIYREHPGDPNPTTRESVRVDASEILHIFRIERAGAVLGLPWGAPCLLTLRDGAELADAMLLRLKLANMYVGVIRMQQEIAGIAPVGQSVLHAPVEEWTPGMMQYLNQGEEIQFNKPPEPGINHQAYMRHILLAVAAGLQIPYEALTGDLSNTNFASGRLGWLQWQRRIEQYRWRILVPRLCQPTVQWFKEGCAVTEPKFLEVGAIWDPPTREMIDPASEVRAAKDAVRAGFRSRATICRQLGEDPDLVLAEAKADRQAQVAGDVMFDTDPQNDLGRKPIGEPGRKAGQAANAPK